MINFVKLHVLKDSEKDGLCDVTQRIKDIEQGIKSEHIHESEKITDTVSTQQVDHKVDEEKTQITPNLKSLSTLMTATASIISETVEEPGTSDSSRHIGPSKEHMEVVMDNSEENNPLYIARRNLKKVQKHNEDYNEQKQEQHVSTSEEDQNVNKTKINDNHEKNQDSKRIPPPKNIAPVISGT